MEDLLNHREELALFLKDSSAELISLSLEIAYFQGKSSAYQELYLKDHPSQWILNPYNHHLKWLIDQFIDRILDLDT